MGTNDKERELSPAERRRRMEARRKRQQKARRKRKLQRLLLILALIAVTAALIICIVFIVRRVSGGDKKISAQGSNYVIAIDAGHGGEDTGVSSSYALEKDVTMNICSKLKIMLESQGYEVVMTRSDDSHITTDERVDAVNASAADLLVSVHCGYSDDANVSGAVSHYKSGSRESRTLGENIQAALVKENHAVDGGSGTGKYIILTSTEIPSVLVEVGYQSNSLEAEDLADDSYQNDTAKGIAKGIIASLER
jgi:N-acetylmuramoyl-L-alanine amidase